MFSDKETYKCRRGFWAVSDKVLVVKLYGKPSNISFIQRYALRADYDDKAVTNFYKEVDKTYKQCNSQDTAYTMGGFNVKVGNGRIGNW